MHVELRNGVGVQLMTVTRGNLVGDVESIHVALGVKLVICYMLGGDTGACGVGLWL